MRRFIPIRAVGFALAFIAPCCSASDKADVMIRDGDKLAQVRTIAIVPAVIQLRFDGSGRLPDPNRMTYRRQAVIVVNSIVGRSLKSRFAIIADELLQYAMQRNSFEVTDLYRTVGASSIDGPTQTIRNGRRDFVTLRMPEKAMKNRPGEMTIFSYTNHDLKDAEIGLASFEPDAVPKLDFEKIRAVARQAGVDAALLTVVSDLDVHEGGADSLLARAVGVEPYKSSRLQILATLVNVNGEIVWRARAVGVEIRKSKSLTSKSFEPEELMALEGAYRAVALLSDSLLGNSPAPSK